MSRDRYSTATYCDFCGRGLNECADMIGQTVAHICDGCVESAMAAITVRRAARATGEPAVRPAPIAITLAIDFEQQAKNLKRVLSDSHAYPAQGGGAGIDNGALPLIEGTLRAIAMLAIKFSKQQQQDAKRHG